MKIYDILEFAREIKIEETEILGIRKFQKELCFKIINDFYAPGFAYRPIKYFIKQWGKSAFFTKSGAQRRAEEIRNNMFKLAHEIRRRR
jgi:hypothetical protein